MRGQHEKNEVVRGSCRIGGAGIDERVRLVRAYHYKPATGARSRAVAAATAGTTTAGSGSVRHRDAGGGRPTHPRT